MAKAAESPVEVRILLAAVAAGKTIREACELARISETHLARWVAFEGFEPLLDAARAKVNPDRLAFDENQLELIDALTVRSERDVVESAARDDERRRRPIRWR
jgi:hypothetical protein